jgi:hypothetical protein
MRGRPELLFSVQAIMPSIVLLKLYAFVALETLVKQNNLQVASQIHRIAVAYYESSYIRIQ